MKAIVIYEAGGTDKLVYTEVPRPERKDGWSLVRIMGRGINHSEIFTRKGLSPTVQFPRILGIECVGIIEETSDSERLPVGAKVISIMGEMGRAYDGSYAEYALIPNEQICVVDSDLPWHILAAIPETYYTAFGSMKNLKIRESDRVLVRGGTSGVGVAFMKLVKAAMPRAFVVGSSRDLSKEQMMIDAGFDKVVTEQNGVLRSGDVFDKVLELIGPATLQDTFRHVDEGGVVCSTGQLGGMWFMDGFDPITDLPANGYLTSFYSNNVDDGRLQEMLDYIERYKVDVKPEKVFHLAEIPQAQQYLESTGSFGKVVAID